MEFDRETVEQVIEQTGARARGERPTLPHPMETDTYLSGHLDAIGSHLIIEAEATNSTGDRALKDKLIDRAAGRSTAQANFNSHVVHSLHQFDHRTRYQREELQDLRDELALALALITQLQRRIDRLESQ